MTPSEEADHIYSLLEQGDISERIALVEGMRDRAIGRLSRLVKLVRRDLSPEVLEAYEAKGWDLSWNLIDPEAAGEFCFSATTYNPTVGEADAIRLLSVCTSVLREGTIGTARHGALRSAYAALSRENELTGKSHRKAQGLRRSGSSSAIVKITKHLLIGNGSDATVNDLWPQLYSALEAADMEPQEVIDRDREKASYSYFMKGDKQKKISQVRFANLISEIRNPKNPITKSG